MDDPLRPIEPTYKKWSLDLHYELIAWVLYDGNIYLNYLISLTQSNISNFFALTLFTLP